MHIGIVAPANPAEFSADLTIASEFPEGMGGVPVNGLIRALLDLGHRVSLFTASPDLTAVWKASGPMLSIVAVPYRRRPRDRARDFFRRERRALAEEIRKSDADVFHAHWTYEFALACIDAKARPLVVTAHDAPLTILRHLPDRYRFVRLLMAFRARLSIRNLTAVSPYLASRWRKEMLFVSPISVISNPIPPLQTQRRGETSDIIILDIADSSARKNVRALLEAFPGVRQDFPSTQLRLAGVGLGSNDQLAEWAQTQGLSDGVEFLGPLSRERVSVELSSATVFCHPSLEESQGICLLEAMNARVPVVAGSMSGGVSWTLFDGDGGVLVDVESPEAIGQALRSIINSPIESMNLADRAFELANARYAPTSIATQYLDAYSSVILAAKQKSGPKTLRSFSIK